MTTTKTPPRARLVPTAHGLAMTAVPVRPAPAPDRWPVPEVLVRGRWIPEDLRARLARYQPRTDLGRIARDCFQYLPPELAAQLLERLSGTVVVHSALHLVVYRAPDSPYRTPSGLIENYGVVSRRVITDAGVDKLEDAFRNVFEPETWNYHGIGTGATAEAVTQTALITELTTQYAPDNTRATGTQSAAAANAYQTVGVNTVDAAVAITEHGLLSQAATGGGTLWDRSQFAAVNLASGDSLQSTYTATFASGG